MNNKDVLSVAPLQLPFDAELAMPGSKSHANRAIIAACLSEGETFISNATSCDDVSYLVENLRLLGFRIRYTNRERGDLHIMGGIPPLSRHQSNEPVELYCGNAGTTVRFLTALACIVPGSWIITGDAAMRKRPIGALVRSLRLLGARVEDTGNCPPVRVQGGLPLGNSTELDAQTSSQYLTALLLIAPVLKRGLRVSLQGQTASQSYVALTRDVLRNFGVRVRISGNTLSVGARSKYLSPGEYDIEGDWSAAGAFLVVEELTHSRVRFTNLRSDSTQADRQLPIIIRRMRKKKKGNLTIDCSQAPDQLMNLAVLAAYRNGSTCFTGAENLRYKECNRLAVLTQELSKTGIDIEEHETGVTVKGNSAKLHSAILDPHNDHRMAFCFALLGLRTPGIRIRNPSCVTKSYPRFFKDMESLYQSPRCIALVGMRGAGKSTLATALASALPLHVTDTDRVFEEKNGPIRKFVQIKSWRVFRKEEEKIIHSALQPGCIVALGGGAIESANVRALLRKNAIVLHLRASSSTILDRLRKDMRPSLTPLPLEEEVPSVLRKRTPLYRSVSDIFINAEMPPKQQVREALSSLRALCSS